MTPDADMAELADALASGASRGNSVQVQVLLSAPEKTGNFDTKLAVFFNEIRLSACEIMLLHCEIASL